LRRKNLFVEATSGAVSQVVIYSGVVAEWVASETDGNRRKPTGTDLKPTRQRRNVRMNVGLRGYSVGNEHVSSLEVLVRAGDEFFGRRVCF
jgi:hypothetical protein